MEKGMKCKLVNPICMFNFNYVGEEFEITEVNDEVIMFKGNFGHGGISREEFDSYFKLIEEPKMFLKLGSKCKVINGIFNGIEGIVDDFTNDDKALIKVQDGDLINFIAVKQNDLELIKEKIVVEHLEIIKGFGREYPLDIIIRGRRTTVKILTTGDKGSVYCHTKDNYSKEEGIDRAFKKALAKKLLREITI